MIPFAIAASLFLTPAAAAAPPAVQPAAEAPMPTGAPTQDYPFVAWCYGVLSGYLDLHDQVMPEVTRIESTWRRPGSNLADDLKIYDTQQRQGHDDLKRFRAALTAAEKASLQPLNVLGSQSIARGRSVWNISPDVTKARVAQEWMSWSLPARCSSTAATLEKRSKLLGASFQANAEPEATAPTAAPPAPQKN
jgi:hypothetical protein